MKKYLLLVLLITMLLLMSACGGEQQSASGHASGTEDVKTEGSDDDQDEEEKMLRMYIGDTEVSVEWQDNRSVDALKELCKDEPMVISMSMYGGFEQVGPLGVALPKSDAQTRTESGDIVLYSGDQMVVFYGSNSWAYTRLGHITDQSEDSMRELLGNGNVQITLCMEDNK